MGVNNFVSNKDLIQFKLIGLTIYYLGCKSIAHSVFGLMGYRLTAHEGERNNCFSKIQLVGPKNIRKHLSLVKAIILVFKAGAFRY